MAKSEQVKNLWEEVNNMLHTTYKGRTGAIGSGLPASYGKELLNDISGLNHKEGNNLNEAVNQVRAKVNIGAAMNIFGTSDVERIQTTLDNLETN